VEPRPAFVEGQNVSAVRTEEFLYLKRSDGRLRQGGVHVRVDEELYDLKRDPAQHHNLGGNDEMRALWTRWKPEPPKTTPAFVHLRLAPGAKNVEGILRSDGKIVRPGSPGEHVVRVSLQPSEQIDFSLTPPDAMLELDLTRDGKPVRGPDLMVGPFGLPFLESAHVSDVRWSWLDAPRPPVAGNRGDLLLWRDPSRAGDVPALAAHANDEVAGMMQRWGYAQPSVRPESAREKR
jgi:hypothetical protein